MFAGFTAARNASPDFVIPVPVEAYNLFPLALDLEEGPDNKVCIIGAIVQGHSPAKPEHEATSSRTGEQSSHANFNVDVWW